MDAPDYLLGTVIAVGGVAMLFVGRTAALMSIEGLSLIVTLAGLILLLAGRRTLRALWFPLLYLTLMLPVWDYAINLFQHPGQRAAAAVATRLLRVSGVPALQQGTTIVLASASLDVMPECSGINQLIALITMALPAAYLWIGRLHRQLTLLALAVVMGFLSNGLRVALLGWLTNAGMDVSAGHSALHLMPGFVTAVLAFGGLAGCLSLLARGERVPPPGSIAISNASKRGQDSRPAKHAFLEVLTVMVMIIAGASQLIATPLRSVDSSGALAGLPPRVGDWTLEPGLESAPSTRFIGFDLDLMRAYPGGTGEVRFVGTDEEVVRTYRNAAGRRLQVYVGYYARQTEGRELTGDASRRLQRVASPLTFASGADPLTVKEASIETPESRRGVIFWYDVNGRILSNQYAVKLSTLWDAVVRRRTNGAVVMVAWDANSTFASTRVDAVALAQELLPVLRVQLP